MYTIITLIRSRCRSRGSGAGSFNYTAHDAGQFPERIGTAHPTLKLLKNTIHIMLHMYMIMKSTFTLSLLCSAALLNAVMTASTGDISLVLWPSFCLPPPTYIGSRWRRCRESNWSVSSKRSERSFNIDKILPTSLDECMYG